MQNSSRKALTVNGRREFPAARPYTESQVVLVAPRADRSSEFPADEAPTRVDLTYDHRDQESWHAAPRHSLVSPPARLPAPEPAPPGRLRHWDSKRLLVFALVALAGFELLSTAGWIQR